MSSIYLSRKEQHFSRTTRLCSLHELHECVVFPHTAADAIHQPLQFARALEWWLFEDGSAAEFFGCCEVHGIHQCLGVGVHFARNASVDRDTRRPGGKSLMVFNFSCFDWPSLVLPLAIPWKWKKQKELILHTYTHTHIHKRTQSSASSSHNEQSSVSVSLDSSSEPTGVGVHRYSTSLSPLAVPWKPKKQKMEVTHTRTQR